MNRPTRISLPTSRLQFEEGENLLGINVLDNDYVEGPPTDFLDRGSYLN
jgi:hypothetical protein